jgi:hypothetical protein
LGATPQETAVASIPTVTNKPKWDDKLAALRAQRREQGLCMKCGGKWGRAHKCPNQVPLHILEELLDVMNTEDVCEEHQDLEDTSSDEEMLALSWSANEGIQGKKTIRLQGLIDKQEILILIDSGSSSTFISSTTAQRLGYNQEDTTEVQVTVANGSKITSNKMISGITWWTQGHTFSTNARVLDLKFYDMVLGMDWLEHHSPMWVHWKRKKLRFTHQGKRITLTGVKDCVSSCPKIKTRKLRGLLRKGGVAQLVQLSPISQTSTPSHQVHDSIKAILQEHADLFSEPSALPPSRSMDHHIELLPGAQPINIKPYRYSPTQKDEI